MFGGGIHSVYVVVVWRGLSRGLRGAVMRFGKPLEGSKTTTGYLRGEEMSFGVSFSMVEAVEAVKGADFGQEVGWALSSALLSLCWGYLSYSSSW